MLTTFFFLSKDQFGSTAIYVGDANYYYAYLPSLVLDHDLDFTNEYRITGNWYLLPPTPTGLPGNVFGIGPSVFTLPFFLVGLLLSKLQGVPPTGFGVYEIRAAMFASAFFTALATWPTALLVRRHFGGSVRPWFIAVATLAGTSAAYYAVRQPGYSHPFAMFWVAAFVNHCDKGATEHAGHIERRWWWIGAGALLGAAALARPQCLTWGLLLIRPAWRAFHVSQSKRKLCLNVLSALLAFAAAFFPQLYAWKVLYGGWFAIPQGAEFMRWDAPRIGAVLFSSRNGLLAFTPLVALCLLGLVVPSRKRLSIAAWLLMASVVQTIVNAAVWDWWAGGAFGGRRFDSCYVAFAFGLASLFAFPNRLRLFIEWVSAKFCLAYRPLPGRVLTVAATMALAAYVVTLGVGNTFMTANTSAPTLLSDGGTPIYKDLQKRIPSPWNQVTAGLSRFVTQPSRLWFARTYGGDRFAYDWVVGKHFLGELYPGLNSNPPDRKQLVSLHPSQKFLVGLEPGAHPVVPIGDRLRILIPINRKHGPLSVRLNLNAPPAKEQMTLRWNSQQVDWASLENSATFVAPGFNRGTNVLDVLLGVGKTFQFVSFELSVPDNGLP
ncbi:MAG: hypothetical protein SF187_23450 [Deltaproteobacteria bacterium]|nr:hypothetical protein [Deltaproteobacteria bacterium]